MATSDEQRPADVLVIFGITGDLAKVMTFRSLYRLEMRKLLECPIVGVAVDDWTVEKLREHARECIEGTGEELDKEVFDRLAERLSYVQGDFSDAAAYGRVADAIKGKETPVFYLEIPPFLFGTVVKGLTEAGLTKARTRRGREAVRARPGLGSRARGRTALVHRRIPALPDRPLPREDGPGRDPPPAVHELDARAGLEPELPRVRPDHDGRGLRRRGPRPLLRPGRRAPGRGREPPDAGRRPRARWRRRLAATPRRSRTHRSALFRAVVEADPAQLRARPVRRLPVDRRRRAGLDDRDVRRPPVWTSRTGAGPAYRSSSGPASGCRSRRPSSGSSSGDRRSSASG